MSLNKDDIITTLLSTDTDQYIEFNLNVNNQTLHDLESELEQFRYQWKKELLVQRDNDNIGQNKIVENNRTTSENAKNAVYLFNKAIVLEQQGRLYEAIKYYRMAMQLDSDIEHKMSASHRLKTQQRTEPAQSNLPNNQTTTKETDTDPLSSLYDQFQLLTVSENRICEKNFTSKVTHFSSLPYEVVIYILKWIVSEQLDLRSLDTFGSVCKGFYVCARDPEIWRLACEKIWSNDCEPLLHEYGDWRSMYMERPRLNFDGCYISKATYTRAGEPSLDHFYRPWHLVEYYRYLRFFPDGSVIMITTPDEPKATVGKLKALNVRDTGVLKGRWTLNSQHIAVFLTKRVVKHASAKQRRGGNREQVIADQEYFYNLDFELSSFGKRSNYQLTWKNYELHLVNKLTNTESQTTFEITKNDFPPFFYSRVKSYAVSSEEILK